MEMLFLKAVFLDGTDSLVVAYSGNGRKGGKLRQSEMHLKVNSDRLPWTPLFSAMQLSGWILASLSPETNLFLKVTVSLARVERTGKWCS